MFTAFYPSQWGICADNVSCSKALLWFYIKKREVGKEYLCLTENRLSRNEMWCAGDIYNHICHIRAEGFLDSNFNHEVIDKISNFYEIAPNVTNS